MGWRRVILALGLQACGDNRGPSTADADAAGAASDGAAADAAADAALPWFSRLLYLADQDEDETYELYLAGLSDELLGVTKINAPTGDLSVRAFGWSPAGDHAFYTVGQVGMPATELHVAPIAGTTAGDPVRVAVDLARSESDEVIGSIGHILWSPDGKHLAFLADETYQEKKLFVVAPGDAGVPVGLTENTVEDFAWSPDGASIAFRGRFNDPEYRLFVVSPRGGPAVRISDSEIDDIPGISLGEEGYGWSPDSRRFHFRGRTRFDSGRQLYVVDMTGGLPYQSVRVNPDDLDESPGVVEARWSPDSSKLAFLYDPSTEISRWLYVADLAGGLRDPPVHEVPENAADLFTLWSPDSRWLAFTGKQEGPTQLFVVDAAAPPLEPLQVNPPLPPGGLVAEGRGECVPTVWSSDSVLLTYQARQEVDRLDAVWVSDLSGGSPAPPVRMSGDAGERGAVGCPHRWTPDGMSVVYAGDEEQDEVFELFLVERASPGAPVKINGELVLDGDLQEAEFEDFDFAWAPGGEWIAYRADQEVDERVELYAVRRAAPGESMRVSSVVELGDVSSFAWAP